MFTLWKNDEFFRLDEIFTKSMLDFSVWLCYNALANVQVACSKKLMNHIGKEKTL